MKTNAWNGAVAGVMRRAMLIFATVTLGACASPGAYKPMVSDFNGDSVKITVPCDLLMKECTKPRPQDQAEADRICGTKGKKAEFASTASKNEYLPSLNTTVYRFEHLFICV